MSTNVLFDVPGPKARRRSLIVSIVATVGLAVALVFLFLTLAAPRVSANGIESPGMFDPTRWDILTDGRMWNAILQRGLLFFRGMPVLLMMLFILLVFSTEAYWAGVAGLAIYNGAIIGEALRSGIQSLPKGQRESGLAIGLTPVQTRFIIEFPQAFRQMLPIIIAQLVVLLKDTSLAYIIAYPELLNIGLRQLPTTYGNRYFFTFFFIVLVVYLSVNLLLSWVARVVAHRTASGTKTKRKGGAPFVGVDTAAMNAVMPDASGSSGR
jgi:glutamate transport system permease protein